jgi:(E)-4-hydroxy-3-methylbut-2-enyl-diphosphate synthase
MKINKARKSTHPVKVGSLIIGGDFPVAVQTMWKEPLSRVDNSLISRIKELSESGCDLLRFTVPDEHTVRLLGKLAKGTELPLVADIHFDHRLALKIMDYPIAKIRINPGNIGAKWKVEEIIKKAGDRGIALRIGVNTGSLPVKLRKEKNLAKAMFKAVEQELAILSKHNFSQVIFSLKSSSVETTIEANELFSAKYSFPLHLGVTEAGPLIPGIIKSTIALSILLGKGIGDTIRVSLSAEPIQEVITGREILKITGIKKSGVQIISCPTCGRTVFPVRDFLQKIEKTLLRIDKHLVIAIMGCAVNGPGEAKHADLGITGSGKHVLIFKKGKVIRRELIEKAQKAFIEEIEKL